MSKFNKEQFNFFLKEYIIYVTSKPTEKQFKFLMNILILKTVKF